LRGPAVARVGVSSDRSEIVWGDWTPLELFLAGVHGWEERSGSGWIWGICCGAVENRGETKEESCPQPGRTGKIAKNESPGRTARPLSHLPGPLSLILHTIVYIVVFCAAIVPLLAVSGIIKASGRTTVRAIVALWLGLAILIVATQFAWTT